MYFFSIDLQVLEIRFPIIKDIEQEKEVAWINPDKTTMEEAVKEYLKAQNLEEKMDKATHIAWATGGSLVPEEIREEYKNTYLDK